MFSWWGWGKEGKEGAWCPEDPQLCYMVVYFYIVNPWGPVLILYFSFLGGLPSSKFSGWAQLSCMLALSVTYIVHAKGMKSAQGVGSVYWVLVIQWLCSASSWIHRAAGIPQEFLEVKVCSELSGCRRIFQAASASSPSTPQSQKSAYHIWPTCSRFHLYNPSGVTISHSQLPDWQVHRRTSDMSKAPILPSALVQTPVFNSVIMYLYTVGVLASPSEFCGSCTSQF